MTSHANRGQYLEEWIEQANQVYNNKGLAVINKIPTPWKIQRNYSPFTKQYQISGAFPEKKSTVDFGGIASSQSIWFDVKVTTHKTSFPLANMHQHQTEYLEKVAKQGGKAFMLIHSREMDKTWILWIDQFFKFKAENERKSIPFAWLEANCEVVPQGNGVMLDYLPIVLRTRRNYEKHEG
jgi:recombination protein U